MNDAVLKGQVGGSHYSTLAIHPFEFAMKNNWDSAAFSILKYLTRYNSKDGLKDLKKARHIVDIRQMWIAFTPRPDQRITMGEYVHANGIADEDAFILMTLESWVYHRSIGAPTMGRMIDTLIADRERETGNKVEIAEANVGFFIGDNTVEIVDHQWPLGLTFPNNKD